MADAIDHAPHPAHRIIAAVVRAAASRSRQVLAIAATALLVSTSVSRAQESDTVTLNFVNADIDAVVKAVSEITGRNFVIDPRVKGTINIVSARPVPKSLVYPTLLSALRLQGFTAVESDGITKIVPEQDAKQQGGPVGTSGASGDRLITQVIVLRNESAAQLVNVLRPLISPNNTIAAYPASNALVITDYADNVRRIMRIIASLDQPPLGEPIVVPVRNASAVDMVTTLNRTFADASGAPAGAAADTRDRVSLVADARSNSILVRSDNPARAIRVRQLIEQLDTPQRAGGNIFIVYLKNADALRVAETLRGLYGGTAGGDRGLPTVATVSSTPAGAAATPTAATVSASITSSPAATTPLSTGAATSAPIVAGAATIQADAANNALIIMAPEPIYNNLRAIIDKLDVRRAQVFIEALVVEVTSDKAGEFGIQWQVLTHGYVFGGTNFGARGQVPTNNIIDASANLANIGQGLNVGVINGTIRLPGVLGEILNLAFLARALATDSNVNILSTPTLLTLDNEEARIMVGSNVPFITGQYAQTGSTTTVTPFQTIERRDVGLLLRVKPQITEGGTVRMVLYQEVSRVDPGTQANVNGPTLTKRSLESSVMIDDKQIVVLGGLIQDQFLDATDKVPYAGDVPVLGQLFRYDTRSRTKTNLLVFLKPTVLRTSADGRTITSERYDYLRGEQADIRPEDRWFWPDTTAPQLPPRPAMPGIAVPSPSLLTPAPVPPSTPTPLPK